MSAYVSATLKGEIRKQFKNLCAYCHTAEALTVVTFEFEHIMPLAAGGPTTFDNLCLACPSCNRHKATRQQAPDPETGELVPLFHPQKDDWAKHFVWDEEGVNLQALTPTGRATIEALHINREQVLRVRRLWVKLGEHPPKD